MASRKMAEIALSDSRSLGAAAVDLRTRMM